jgi:hypothetical protein
VKHHLLPIENVFSVHVHIVIGNADRVNAWFRRNYVDLTNTRERLEDRTVGNYVAFDPKNPREYRQHFISIGIDRCTDRRDRADTLLHEAVHCAVAIVEDKGMHVATNDEPLAYLVEWIYKNALPVVMRATA